jgi:Uma2 family endonuclease
MPLPRQEEKYSYADYLTWREDERWEIIDGVPYMQASPSPTHQLIIGELYRQFANYLQGKPCKVYLSPFCVRLIKGDEKQSEDIKKVFEPDITIVCDRTKIDKEGCKGSPDLIIEVMSPSSIRHDKVTKFNNYEKAGVKEYWIVEPDGRLVSVFLLQTNNRYGRPEIYTEDQKITVSIFPDLSVDLNTVFPLNE